MRRLLSPLRGRWHRWLLPQVLLLMAPREAGVVQQQLALPRALALNLLRLVHSQAPTAAPCLLRQSSCVRFDGA